MQHGLMMVAVAALLSGCTTDAIRIDRATAVGTAGHSAVAATTALLGEVDAANREKLIAVAALDPACDLRKMVIFEAERPGGRYCLPAGQRPARNDVVLTRFYSRDFTPALVTLQGLSTYLGALDAILTRERPDVGVELDDAIAQLTGVLGNVGTIFDTSVTVPLSDEQRQAATGALSLVSGIANQAQTVAELRRFETPERDIAFQETVARLRLINDGLAAILDLELAQREQVLRIVRRTSPNSRQGRREEIVPC